MDFIFESANKPLEKIVQELETNFDGLNEEQARKKKEKFGENKIQSVQIDLLEIIKRNSLNFFNFFLLLASFLSFAIEGPGVESGLIFFFLILSIVVAVFQDYRANKLTEKLLSYFKHHSLVKRNGQWQRIESKNLVPGDYIRVEAGWLIPADVRITKAEDLLVNESIISGESEPVFKDTKNIKAEKLTDNKQFAPTNIGLMGSTVIKGELEGIVLSTGKNTYFGSLAKKTLEIKKETAYKKMMDDFAKKIGYVAIIVAILIILSKILLGNYSHIQEIVIFTIVLAVAIVPEFLPTMTVLTLSLAGNKLSKKGLIIKRLSAIEDLGSIEVLCTDKTGTLTTGEMKLQRIISQNEKEFTKYFLADYYLSKELTPYEKSFIEAGLGNENDYQDYKLIEDVEFDPIKRIRKIIIQVGDQKKEITKGAPEEVIDICFNNKKELIEEKKYWLSAFQKEDSEGLRTLAMAIDGEFWGIASFIDPIKKTAFEAIELAKKLNLEIKILTGDSPQVAYSVAKKLGLIENGEKVILGEEIRNVNEEKIFEIVKNNNVFARVLPEDKLRIVEILQREKFVGFLGEGINDALALKVVNVALVVDNATDVTKQEADIILLKKDLKAIIEGISFGRKTLENIGKYVKHTMSDNFGNLTSVAFLTSFLPYVPLTPIQVLLTNFLTDIPLVAFADDNVKIEEIRKPIKMSSHHLILLLLILGGIAGIINIIGFVLVKDQPVEVVRTYLFLLTTLTGLAVSFSIRTKDWFFRSKPSFFFSLISALAICLSIIIVFNQFFMSLFDFAKLEKSSILQLIILVLVFLVLTEIAKKK
ncbi:MAG: cation-translocating P-type ATPase, partial [Patescibacteria group bacterium]|nr:cation-translocating P-type ATPase [Patescibacteria group bacterium]